MLFGEAPHEVAGRRRTRDHLRSEGVHVGDVVAQTVEVLEPPASAEDVAGDIHDVVRLAVGEMALEEIEPIVDLTHQPDPVDQLADHSDPTEAHRPDPVPDLEMDLPRPEDRLRPTPPTPGPGLARPRPPPPTGTVLSALIVRDCFHRKGLLVETRGSRHGYSNYFQDKPFRYFILPRPPNHAYFGSSSGAGTIAVGRSSSWAGCCSGGSMGSMRRSTDWTRTSGMRTGGRRDSAADDDSGSRACHRDGATRLRPADREPRARA